MVSSTWPSTSAAVQALRRRFIWMNQGVFSYHSYCDSSQQHCQGLTSVLMCSSACVFRWDGQHCWRWYLPRLRNCYPSQLRQRKFVGCTKHCVTITLLRWWSSIVLHSTSIRDRWGQQQPKDNELWLCCVIKVEGLRALHSHPYSPIWGLAFTAHDTIAWGNQAPPAAPLTSWSGWAEAKKLTSIYDIIIFTALLGARLPYKPNIRFRHMTQTTQVTQLW